MIEHIILKEHQQADRTKLASIKSPLWLAKPALEKPRTYNGFMGVSQGKPYFSKENIEVYFKFALEHFDRFLLIVDDWLAQHNYAAFRGLSDEEALEKARTQGDKNLRTFERVKRKLLGEKCDADRIRIATLSELIDDQVRQRITVIDNHYQQNPKFRKDMRNWFWKYMRKEAHQSGLKGEALERAVERSLNYLKEEIAVLNTVPEMGYQIEIYPGENKVQQNILNGKYPALSSELGFSKNYGHIDVRMTDPLLTRISRFIAGTGKQARRQAEETLRASLLISGLAGMVISSGIGLYAGIKESAEREAWHRIAYGAEKCNHKTVFGGTISPSVPRCYFEFHKRGQ